MGKPVLFDYWRSSASYRVRIALNLKSVAYDARPVNLLTGAHRNAEHLSRNPQGAVPVLDIDGLRLTQSLAILEYLEETRPTPSLVPPGAAERARVRALAHLVAMDIHPICNLSVVRRIEELGGEAARLDWMRGFMKRGLTALERLLDHPATGRYCHGDEPGMADCCLVPQLYNARRWGLDSGQWPVIERIDSACAELSAFADAHPAAIGAPNA